jgi:hypothetical protein
LRFYFAVCAQVTTIIGLLSVDTEQWICQSMSLFLLLPFRSLDTVNKKMEDQINELGDVKATPSWQMVNDQMRNQSPSGNMRVPRTKAG